MTLVVADVTRTFGGVRAVDGVSFRVEPGEVHGLIGPNGAGKTTLVNLVSGLMAPTAGSIALDGLRLDRRPAHRVAAAGVSRTWQNIRLFGGLSALDNVVVGLHLVRRAAFLPHLLCLPGARAERLRAHAEARALLARVGLEPRSQEQVKTLSYGEQRRVEIARALAARPRVLLLDEPTAGMNAGEAAAVAALVRSLAEEGRSVLLIEHNVPLVMELCRRVTVLSFGKVIARGTPAEVARDPEVIAAYLGTTA
ncbi:MAG TPA: ABC transporter ATP-binding protein [Haliangiales bacterium]|nr:ABC transporter ATP-binding protein [Haliangiales bacterium]